VRKFDDEEHEQGEERGDDEVERSPRRWTQVGLEDMTDEQDHDEDEGDPRACRTPDLEGVHSRHSMPIP